MKQKVKKTLMQKIVKQGKSLERNIIQILSIE